MTTDADQVAQFVMDVSFDNFNQDVVRRIKGRILDSVGIAIGAIGEKPVKIVHDTAREIEDSGDCRLWGTDEFVSPVQATMYNTALVRYLDYMDSFLAPGETPHPSDNIAAVIVCGQYEDRSGKQLIEAVGIAYEIQALLAWKAPVRDRGWDHVTHTIFSATGAAAKTLGLGQHQISNALGIAGTAHNALRVTRTGKIGMWKGIASANTARNAVYSTLLARKGMNGPNDVFEGEKGWKQIVAGDFDIELDPSCESVKQTMAKRYVAETYSQSAVEGLLELINREDIDPSRIESIHLKTFHGAYQIIGGGKGGDRYEVEDKEQADHSLPYMLAVAALDGQLMNEQYEEKRIRQEDVQSLLRSVTVEEKDQLTERFEGGEMPAVLEVTLEDGTTHAIEKSDFPGHPNNPMGWEQLEEKFHGMASDFYDVDHRKKIIDVVQNLENRSTSELVKLLGPG